MCIIDRGREGETLNEKFAKRKRACQAPGSNDGLNNGAASLRGEVSDVLDGLEVGHLRHPLTSRNVVRDQYRDLWRLEADRWSGAFWALLRPLRGFFKKKYIKGLKQ